MKHFSKILLLIFLMAAVSCSKEEGEGGTSSIRGKVHAKYYDEYFTDYLGEAYAQDEDVYIIYGDDFSFSDRVRTNYDGSFEFNYLRKGNYRIYAYSKDSTLTEPSGKYAVIQEVEITKGNEVTVIPDIEIVKN